MIHRWDWINVNLESLQINHELRIIMLSVELSYQRWQQRRSFYKKSIPQDIS